MKKIALLKELKDARRAATMERASFGFPEDTVTHEHHFQPKKTEHPDAYIKEKTRLYRETWIIAPLDAAIKIVEDDIEQQKKRKTK